MTATKAETSTIEHLDFTACCQMKWAWFQNLHGIPFQVSNPEMCHAPAAFYGTVHLMNEGCLPVVRLICQDHLKFANELCRCGAPYLSNIQPLSGKW